MDGEMKARPHQRAAIRKIVASFDRNRRLQVHMACGTGKTLVGARVADELGARKTLVLVPSLALISQTYKMYRAARQLKDWEGLVVCQGALRGRGSSRLPLTSEPEAVESFLRERGPRVVFCTYQSGEKLADLKFDLGIFDEAHKTTGSDDKLFAFALYDENVSIRRRLFLTATPRRSVHTEEGPELVHDMAHNEEIYGPTVYSLPFRKAVKSNLICDYRVVICVQKKSADMSLRAALQTAVCRAMKKYGLKKAFTYHPSVRSALQFNDNAEKVFGSQTNIFHLNGRMRYSDRLDTMSSFDATTRGILTSSRCLIEGVDVPAVDLAVFTSPKRSVVDVVQATGRTLRKDPKQPSKKTGYVLIPVFVREGEDAEKEIQKTKFRYIYDILQAMQDQDEVLHAQLLDEGMHPGGLENVDNLDIEILDDLNAEQLRKAISVRILKNVVGVAAIRKAKLLKLAKSGEPKPTRSTNYELAVALTNYAKRKSNPSYDADFREQLEELAPQWFLDPVEGKKEMLRRLAKAGAARPKSGTTLGNALTNYTGRSGKKLFNLDFRAELEKLAPEWFSNSADEKKQLLLERAMRGDKPTWHKERRLREMLRLYIKPGSKVYDPEFCEKLKTIAPDWVDTRITKASDKKKVLLELAEKGARRPRGYGSTKAPLEERKLGAALHHYITVTDDSYDEEFTRRMFKLAPRWFPHRHKHPVWKRSTPWE